MEKKITIDDVARDLGVSKTTVSRAISGKGRISEETRRRVQEYIARTEYKPNVIAKGLAQQKTYNIAVILPADCEVAELPFFQNCMLGICKAASAREYDVLAVYTNTGETGDLERIISNHKIDGVILSRTLVQDAAAEYIKAHHVPVVAVGSSPDETLIQVDHHHRNACMELTKHLLDSGKRYLGLIGGDEKHVVTRNRYEGFADAYRIAGRPVERSLIFLGAEGEEDIVHAVDELVMHRAECIVCMDDRICKRVLKYLESDGISVPEQIKVASFYEGSLAGKYEGKVPALKFDAKKLGEVTCNTLLDVIEGVEVPGKQLLPYEVSFG